MTIDFKNLSAQEYDLLLQFPAYVSLLAANTDGELDDAEILTAIDLAHVKTYTSNSLMADFFKEVDKNFEKTLQVINNSIPNGKDDRETVIKSRLSDIEEIVSKLSAETVTTIHKSMKGFKDHVSRAHHNVLVDFLFPIPIPGLNDH
jgi:hypothetical protein